jgi:hemolysin III
MQPEYSTGEEIANSITHGLGVALAVAGFAVLVTLASDRGDAWQVASFSVYGVSLILLYLVSTLYHGLTNPRTKKTFKFFDHASIYILIAGTYTPFTLVAIRGGWGWSLFGVIWGLAILGILFKIKNTERWGKISAAFYVLMGWLCVIALHRMIATISTAGLIWLFSGGVLYTSGLIFYGWKKLPYNHAVWHLFVLGGSICHFVAILFHVPGGRS